MTLIPTLSPPPRVYRPPRPTHQHQGAHRDVLVSARTLALEFQPGSRSRAGGDDGMEASALDIYAASAVLDSFRRAYPQCHTAASACDSSIAVRLGDYTCGSRHAYASSVPTAAAAAADKHKRKCGGSPACILRSLGHLVGVRHRAAQSRKVPTSGTVMTWPRRSIEPRGSFNATSPVLRLAAHRARRGGLCARCPDSLSFCGPSERWASRWSSHKHYIKPKSKTQDVRCIRNAHFLG